MALARWERVAVAVAVGAGGMEVAVVWGGVGRAAGNRRHVSARQR